MLMAMLLSPLALSLSPSFAQTKISRVDEILTSSPSELQERLGNSAINPAVLAFAQENSLDTIDQEKLPRIVTMGLILNANMSNFLITGKSGTELQTTSSYLRAGVEAGGFMDFLVTKHFAIQARLLFTAEQNQFGNQDSTNHLWSFGADIPVLFLHRVGNLEKGYFNIGAGPFAHFTFASNKGIYHNVEPTEMPVQAPPAYLALHDNHAGLMAYVGYEFPIGIQIGFNYMISLSDVFGYYKTTQGTPENNVAFYPQRLSLGIAYRWKN